MDTADSFQLVAMPHIIFGSGTIAQIGQQASQVGSRALVVTGRGSLRQSGWLDNIITDLNVHNVAVTLFEGVEPEPAVETVEKGRQKLRQTGCDMVVAVGGGSSMDVGKAIGGLANAPQSVASYHRGEKEIPESGLPLIVAPTTAGTGTEVTPNAVLIDSERGVKASIRADSIIPTVAIVDPKLTLTMPPAATAHSGMDAFTHALEGFTSRGANIVTDKLTEEAIVRLGSAIRTAYHDGNDLLAQANMSLGSLLAGIGFASSRLGLVHGLAHPVGAVSKQPHGRVCALLLPHVIQFNMKAAQAKYAQATRLIEITDDPDDEVAAQQLHQWVVALNEEFNIGKSLSELGVSEDDLAEMIDPALASGSTQHNPREVSEADVWKFLRQIL